MIKSLYSKNSSNKPIKNKLIWNCKICPKLSKNQLILSKNNKNSLVTILTFYLILKSSFLIFNIGIIKENITNHTWNKFYKNRSKYLNKDLMMIILWNLLLTFKLILKPYSHKINKLIKIKSIKDHIFSFKIKINSKSIKLFKGSIIKIFSLNPNF